MRSRRNSDVLKCPSLPVDIVAYCACARIPDWALGKIIAARRHRELAGCSAELHYFVYICVSIYLSTWILNESFVFMLFWNNDYFRGLAGHMRPATSAVRPASAQCCWLCHISSDGLVESDCKHRAAPFTENIPVFRGEKSKWELFRLLYIIRQVTIPYSALQFRRNSPVFWCFEIQCQGIRYRVAHACGSRCTLGCKHWAPLLFAENIRLPMWILSIAISIIDLNVHRWSTTKLM